MGAALSPLLFDHPAIYKTPFLIFMRFETNPI